MKPRLGKKIYIVNRSGCYISLENVGFLGEDSFIVKDYILIIGYYEYYYEDYGSIWFSSLSSAKKYLLEYFKENVWDNESKYHFAKISDTYWCVEYL